MVNEVLIMPPIQFIVKGVETLPGVTIVDIEEDELFTIQYFQIKPISIMPNSLKNVLKNF